jgi:hypothetical protein
MVYNLSRLVKGNEEQIMSATAGLDRELLGLTSLEKILAWMQANELPFDRLDLVAQDEFCHDLFVPWQERWLIFGLT